MDYYRIFFEQEHFFVAIPNPPHIDRKDGGHLVIVSKGRYNAFYEMPKDQACELITLAQACGKALQSTLTGNGIKIGIVNYQINGNWSVNQSKRDPIHMHIYGRAVDSIFQKYGEALSLPNPDNGFYDHFRPLTNEEIETIRSMLIKSFGEE